MKTLRNNNRRQESIRTIPPRRPAWVTTRFGVRIGGGIAHGSRKVVDGFRSLKVSLAQRTDDMLVAPLVDA